ncbi:SulP family inorganic anion transporter [Piscinibacterium candidicorallinum]|uniref:SulP family inorganic anion transporter n=1 Tax=Piscinibacterium candidicorallinum TaxID=1793872 RepID=A0ABV7H432_9BURK
MPDTPERGARRLLARLQFRPYLLDALRGYDRALLARDVAAGVTVGVVALPLAMAFAIASGLPPQAGIFTAIIAGLLISALGGCRLQIGGPAGAYIVIVFGIVERYGVANLIIATALAGVLLFALGALRLGGLVRFIPVSVVIGFTNGIAVLIALSQFKDFLGLRIERMPADFFAQIRALAEHIGSINPYALTVAGGSLALVVLWSFALPGWKVAGVQRAKLNRVPGTIVALILATALVAWLQWPVETIGSKFGDIPRALPAFALPEFSWASVKQLFIPTLTIAMLGAIESLLCARVADSMTGDRHNPNQELMAQGIANFVTPFFGGMPATGTIARTVTNVKSGGATPVSGIVHALTLLVVVLVAAPLASKVPLAALAGILMFVAWNMGEWREFARLPQFRWPYRASLLGTFLLTVIVDLTVAVEVGLVIACITFIYRISSLTHLEAASARTYPVLGDKHSGIAAWRLYGALFFGAVHHLERLTDALPARVLVLDLKNVLYMDTSGLEALQTLHATCAKAGVRLLLAGAIDQPGNLIDRSGFGALLGPDDRHPTLEAALIAAAASPAPT